MNWHSAMHRSTRGRATTIVAALVMGATSLALPIRAGAETVTVRNKLADGYKDIPLPGKCTNGFTIIDFPKDNWLERPHFRFNPRTNMWVMWGHLESGAYTGARAIAAYSPTECGAYTIAKTFRPLDKEVRDDFLFADDDGTAYFLAASRKNGGANDTLAIFKLKPDWLDVDETAGVNWAFENRFREAPIVMKKDGVYFLLTSEAAGWHPSQGMYATSTSMMGPWSSLAPLGNRSTFGGQNAAAAIIKGTNSTAYLLRLDHLGGNEGRNTGAFMLPVLLDSKARTATLKWYSTYQINTVTGTLTLPSTDNLAANRRALASNTGPGSSPQGANDRSYQTGWFASGNGNWPAWWMTDLGSPKHVGEIQISWPMTNGSEALYQYRLEFSTDGTTWTSIDRRDNKLYGFTVDKMDLTARYVRVRLDNAILTNNPFNWYTPGMWDVTVLP